MKTYEAIVKILEQANTKYVFGIPGEEVYLKAYETLTQVQAAISWYINFYNRNRISNVV